MQLSLLENDRQTVREALEASCAVAESARIAVAYAKRSGLVIADALTGLVEKGVPVHFIAGVDFQLTDLEVVKAFDRPPSEARLWFEIQDPERKAFHPKLYLFESRSCSLAIIGSSNFSGGGLTENVEANLLVEGPRESPIIRSVRDFHTALWTSPFSIGVTGAFRERYERLQLRRREVELQLREEADYTRASSELRQAVAEAVAEYRAPGERRCWLLITSPENYIRNIEGHIWGDERRGRISQVRTGDLIFFYVKRMMVLAAMGMVTTELYEDHTIHWRDGRVYPHRFGFGLFLQPPVQVPFRPLVPQLDLFRRTDDPHWGQRLQRSMVRLSDHDCRVLRYALSMASGARESA